MKKFLSNIFTMILKDWRVEWKTREMFLTMLIFALSILFILNFALDKNIKAQTDGAAGLIWVILILAGQLGINQVINIEKNANMLEALLSAPISRSAIYLGKTVAAFLAMLTMSLIVFPLYSIFYNFSLPNLQYIWVCLLSCWGYAAVGILISTMTLQSRTRDILLPVLFFPIIIPLAVAAIKATALTFEHEVLTLTNYWISQLIAFDIIFTVAGILGFDIIAEG